MHRSNRRSAAVLVLALSAWSIPSPAARAAVPAGGEAEAKAALAALDALARRTRANGGLPRWSDPEGRGVLARFWDAPAILGTPPYPASDTPALLGISQAANAVYKTYVLYAPQPGALPDIAANTLAYQEEIARASAFALQVQAAELQALEGFVTALPPEQFTPTRRAGLRQAHLGVTQFFTSVIELLRVPGLRSQTRGLVVDALVATAGPIAAEMTRPDRAVVLAQIAAAQGALSVDEAARLVPVRNALARPDCDGLCKLE